MKANDLSKFSFAFAGYGHYKVTYTTGRGDYWRALINDMMSIDRTKNAEWAKVDDINTFATYANATARTTILTVLRLTKQKRLLALLLTKLLT